MKFVRVFAILLVLLLVGGGVLGFLFRDQIGAAMSNGADGGNGIEVQIEQATRRTLIESVAAPGEIEPLKQVQISAEVSATITQLSIREGDHVKRGDLLAMLDDRDLRATLRAAEAQRDGQKYRLEADKAALEGQNARLEFARRELERMQQLYETGDVSRREYDNALERVEDLETTIKSTTWQIATAESSLAAAEAEIQRSQDGLSKTSLLSPIDGTITLLNVEAGEVVTGSFNNPGTVLMTIADLDRMLHIAEVAETDVGRVEVGQDATLHINGFPGETFSGRVTHIALQRSGAPDGTGFFRAEIEIERRGKLIRSGHVANAEIEIETHDGVVVPYQAIVARRVDELPQSVRNSPHVSSDRSTTNVVYRVIDGKAVCTPVEAGPSDVTHRVILAGLEDGEAIVTGPFKVLEDLRDGKAVKPMNASATDNADAAGDDIDEDASGEDSTATEAADEAPADTDNDGGDSA